MQKIQGKNMRFLQKNWGNNPLPEGFHLIRILIHKPFKDREKNNL
jgi:hypothetical protein